MKFIREGRMGPPKAFKTGAIVGTYPKPMLVFVFDEEGLGVIPERTTTIPKDYIQMDCTQDDIEWIKPGDVSKILADPARVLKKITAIDFCDTQVKTMDIMFTPKPDQSPYMIFMDTLNSLVNHANSGKPFPWKTVVLDPLTRFCDIVYMLVAAVKSETIKDLRLSHPLISQKVQQMVSVITCLPAHVAVIMHRQIDKDEKTGMLTELPMIQGRYREKINSQFPSFFYAIMENGKPKIRTKNFDYVRVGLGATFPVGLPDPCEPDFKSIYGKELQ